MKDSIQKFQEMVDQANSIVVFTGAGISTESGISDYRSKGGIWEKFQPVTIQEFVASSEKRKLYWKRKFELYESMEKAKPNAAHQAVVELEKRKKLLGLVTQNIDGLHQMAGTSSEKILELHGTNRETVCLSCGEIRDWVEVFERLKSGDEAPLCVKCGGLLKPNTISFGQSLNPDVLDKAVQLCGRCDLMVVIGSTLIVEPAASMPRIAKENGAKLIIITLSETPIDHLADLKIESKAGEFLSSSIKM